MKPKTSPKPQRVHADPWYEVMGRPELYQGKSLLDAPEGECFGKVTFSDVHPRVCIEVWTEPPRGVEHAAGEGDDVPTAIAALKDRLASRRYKESVRHAKQEGQ